MTRNSAAAFLGKYREKFGIPLSPAFIFMAGLACPKSWQNDNRISLNFIIRRLKDRVYLPVGAYNLMLILATIKKRWFITF